MAERDKLVQTANRNTGNTRLSRLKESLQLGIAEEGATDFGTPGPPPKKAKTTMSNKPTTRSKKAAAALPTAANAGGKKGMTSKTNVSSALEGGTNDNSGETGGKNDPLAKALAQLREAKAQLKTANDVIKHQEDVIKAKELVSFGFVWAKPSMAKPNGASSCQCLP